MINNDIFNRLRYTHATILEIQRLSFTAPASLLHYATEDIQVQSGDQNYTIPRGGNVLCNLRKFLLDPNIFEEPQKFSPERFLDSDGSIIKYDQVTKIVNGQREQLKQFSFQFTPFGIGKRICLGESLAKDSIFIFFTMMVQNLKFDADPAKPRPNPEDTIMIITNMLKPFHVNLSQRK